ncbi:MAG: MATE family efflux transporter [Clostridiales bacterium]|nr:MATE family efflux transporter [Clostridiales bacterium]
MIKNRNKNSNFYKMLFAITIPIILQSLITSSLNMLDTMMIGKVGEIELASVGIANQYYFLFTLLILGVSGGGGVLAAQLWGKKDLVNIKKTLSKSLTIGLFISLVIITFGLLIPEKIMSIFSTDSSVIYVGSSYLRITVISYFFTAISFTYASFLRSIGNAKLPMFASLLGLIVNGLLNYILIFGYLGMPRLGTVGAATATLIARICECLIILGFVYLKDKVLNINLSDFIQFPKQLSKTLLSVTLPIVLNEACWGLGNVTYIAIYARISTAAAASMQICSTIMNLFMIFAFGLSYASVVVIGNEIGAGNETLAKEHSKKIAKLSVIVALIMSVILLSSAKPIVSFFNVSDAVKTSSIYILCIYSFVMVIKMFNMVMIVGIFRGGGDATYWSVLQGITLWCVGIPLAYFAAFESRLPVHYVVAFTAVEELIKLLFVLSRFHSFKWIRNIVKDTPTQIETTLIKKTA